MKLNDAKQIVHEICEAGLVPLLWGERGIGKTALVHALADEVGRELRPLYLATQEPGDLIGLPTRDGDRTTWALPDWWPKEGERVIIFLDEINRAPRYTLSAILPLLTERRLHGHPLPPDTWIVAAANPPNGVYHVTDFDSALVNRFVHLIITPDWDGWFQWLSETDPESAAGVGLRLRAWQLSPAFRDTVGKDEFSNSSTVVAALNRWNVAPTISPRSLAWAARLFVRLHGKVDTRLLEEVLVGVLGEKANAVLFDLNSANLAASWFSNVQQEAEPFGNRPDKITQTAIKRLSRLLDSVPANLLATELVGFVARQAIAATPVEMQVAALALFHYAQRHSTMQFKYLEPLLDHITDRVLNNDIDAATERYLAPAKSLFGKDYYEKIRKWIVRGLGYRLKDRNQGQSQNQNQDQVKCTR